MRHACALSFREPLSVHLRVRLIVCPGEQHSARPRKAGDVVHVAVGVLVSVEPLGQPQHLRAPAP
jgi:hypothetical protein